MKKKYIFKKILAGILIFIILLPVMLYVFFQIPFVQKYLTKKVSEILSKQLSTEVTVQKVSYTFLNDIIISDLYVGDYREDTLFFVNKLTVRPLKFRLKNNEFRISRIKIENFKARIYEDTLGNSNLDIFLDNLSNDKADNKEKTKESHFDFKVDNFKILKSSFSLQKQNWSDTIKGFNSDNFYITDLNTDVKDFHIIDDSLYLELNNLRFKDTVSGFDMKKLSSKSIIYSPQNIILDEFFVKMKQTELNFYKIGLNYKTTDDFDDFINKVNLDIQLKKNSKLALGEIGYFVEDLFGYNQIIKLSGDISGTVSNLTANALSLKYGENTNFHTNFNIIGLPDIDKTYFDVSIDTLSTSKKDILSFKDPEDTTRSLIELPAQLKNISKLNYSAKIVGLSSNFIIVGGLKTNLGSVDTDIRISRDSLKTNVFGIVNLNELNIGNFIGNEKIGNLTFNDTIDINLYKDKSIAGNTNGFISKFYFNNYTYQNVVINGDFINEFFKGNVVVKDTNLICDFSGSVDFSENQPSFDFTLNVDSAQLYKLNIEKKEPNTYISFGLQTHLDGIKLDDITGDANFTKPFFYNKDTNQLVIDTFLLSSYVKNYFGGKENKEIIINSDYLEGRIIGFFEFESLINYGKNLVSSYLPVLGNEKKEENIMEIIPNMQIDKANVFRFSLNLKNSKQITDFFAPTIKISDNSLFVGSYNSYSNQLSVNLKSDSIKIKDKKVLELKLIADTKNDSLKINFYSKKISLNKDYFLDNINLHCAMKNDTVNTNLKWKNNSDSINKINLHLITTLFRDTSKNLSVKNYIKRDTLYLNNREWVFDDSEFNLYTLLGVDSNVLVINNFHLKNDSKKQHIGISGKILTSKPEKGISKKEIKRRDSINQICIVLKNFDIAELKPIIGDLDIEGRIGGSTNITNITGTPIINSSNVVSGLVFNGVNLETLVAESKYNTDSAKVGIHIYTQKNINDGSTIQIEDKQDTVKERFVEVTGDYYLETNEIDFNVFFKKFKLKAFQPYFENVIDKMANLTALNGYVNIRGTSKEPDISGDLQITNGTFRVKATQALYTINGSLDASFNNKEILIRKTKINNYGGTGFGYISGEIKHNNFKDIYLDILFSPERFVLLNLPKTDSSLYYGKLSATGEVSIKGALENIVIAAQISTESDTDLKILLNNSSEIKEENPFITFVENDTISKLDTTAIIEVDENVKIEGLSLNLNLEINPLSKFQLVMDETSNEIIYLQAEGNLKFKLNPFGDMVLLGTLGIVKGVYNFKMQNIISKEFEVEKGSTIKWTGSPTDAILDITAIYKMKNISLFDLVLDEEYRQEKTLVDCQIKLTEDIMSPNLVFGVDLPKADEKITSQLKHLEQQDINKQVLSLLIMGRFQPLPGLTASSGAGGVINTSEVISNQLTHWLSDIDENMEVTVGEVSSEDVELAISRTFFDDRITVNTEVSKSDENTTQEGASSIVGDVEIEGKINKKGTVKAKFFNKSNRNEVYEKGPYTQGLGVFFKKDFNWFYRKD